MEELKTYMESGILELYALGATSEAECREVEAMIANHPEVAAEVESLTQALNGYTEEAQMTPPADVKDALITGWDELAAAESEESKTVPAVLSGVSTLEDYTAWIESEELQPPAEYDNLFFIPFQQSERGITAMVWMKEGSPAETHHDLIEKFLIVEGSCEIEVEGKIHVLSAGDYLSIPLHLEHTVTVTSDIPCKILLQRIAA